MLDNKKTKWFLASLIGLISLSYIFSSFGLQEWVTYINVGLGVTFGIFILIMGGVVGYIRQKKWKTLNSNDLVTWLSAVVGPLIILNSFFVITSIRNLAPDAILNFLSITGAIFGGLAGFIGIAFLFIKTPNKSA